MSKLNLVKFIPSLFSYCLFLSGFKSCRDDYKCPSVALMFQIGDDATYHNVSHYVNLRSLFIAILFSHSAIFSFLSPSFIFFKMSFSSLYKMGGCKESPDTCNRTSCRGHEVDIMHFSLGNSIPGRLYGEDLTNVNSKSGG